MVNKVVKFQVISVDFVLRTAMQAKVRRPWTIACVPLRFCVEESKLLLPHTSRALMHVELGSLEQY